MAKRDVSSSDPRILFGQHLAMLRKKRGLPQQALPWVSGLARSYLGGVERGQRNIALLNIRRLAEALGLPPSELLGFVPGPRRKQPPHYATLLHASFAAAFHAGISDPCRHG